MIERFRKLNRIIREIINFMKSPKIVGDSNKEKKVDSKIKYIWVALGTLFFVLAVFVIDQNKNFNKKENVKAEEVVAPISLSKQKKNERDIKALVASISFAATSIFDVHKTYASLCKNGVLGTNLPSMKSYVDVLLAIQEKKSQSDAGIKCVASPQSYAVSIVVFPPYVSERLSSCIDSSGFIGVGKIGLKPLACTKE